MEESTERGDIIEVRCPGKMDTFRKEDKENQLASLLLVSVFIQEATVNWISLLAEIFQIKGQLNPQMQTKITLLIHKDGLCENVLQLESLHLCASTSLLCLSLCTVVLTAWEKKESVQKHRRQIAGKRCK